MLKLMALTVIMVTSSLLSYRSISSAYADEPHNLCKEVEVELYNSVKEGILRQEDADAIVGRCIRYHSHKRG